MTRILTDNNRFYITIIENLSNLYHPYALIEFLVRLGDTKTALTHSEIKA